MKVNSASHPVSILARIYFLLLYVSLIEASGATSSSADDEISKQQISIDYLPDEYSDSKLPNKQLEGDTCFEYIGCVEKIPKLPTPSSPSDSGTGFLIANRQGETLIRFEETWNCALKSRACKKFPFNLKKMIESNFKPHLPTVIVTPGYMTKSLSSWPQEVKDLWLKLEDVNVILVAWDKASRGLYSNAAANTKVTARQITVFLYYLAALNNRELDEIEFSDSIYLVGHSLGAHVSAFVGQDFAGKVGRITGLDPAGPKFSDLIRKYKLDRTDAQLVDVIHTNAGQISFRPSFGAAEMMGHIDYYANDGKHQPGCSNDMFGCSHKLAPDYYSSFLTHEIHMRSILESKSQRNLHRIIAVKGDDYEKFHNGTSLSESCPITTLDDGDLSTPDIENCTLPMDFVSSFSEFKNELETKYKVNFDPHFRSNSKYFFYTGKSDPWINNHHFVKMRLTKSPHIDSVSAFAGVCNIAVEMEMRNKLKSKQEVSKYQLIEFDDHFEVTIPYLSPSPISRFELAGLDSHDYYLDEADHSNLYSGILEVFPTVIRIVGLKIDGANGGSFMTFFKSIFNLNSKKKGPGDSLQCDVSVETVLVQPLKRLHRHLAATYTLGAKDKQNPDLVIVETGDSSPKADLLQLQSSGGERLEFGSDVFISKVILGPLDKDLIADASQNGDGDNEEVQVSTESPDIPRAVWLLMTIVLIAIAAASIVLNHFEMGPFARTHHADREMLV